MAQNIITIGAVVTAVMAIGALITMLVKKVIELSRFIEEQKQQTVQINLMKEELELMTEGIFACLNGLHEQGCNGPVTKTLEKYEYFLNKRAHK